jgi:hypothetical protein
MLRAVKVIAVAATSIVVAGVGVAPASSDGLPSGERLVGHGHAAVEPAYNADTGALMYLLTPAGAPLPAISNSHARSPLYLVEYPPGYDGTLNCMGVPGNCPDHDGLVAGVATGAMPSVYGTDPTALPGHDHIADPPGAPDWNVAWEVIEVLWTDKAVADGAITHVTTDGQIQDAVKAGYLETIDLGFAFNCSVVSSSVYARGVPVSGG